ncbi:MULTISPECIES: oxygenase MpaB family protein [unclassified Caulobacter]|uniref:oxygenase MpaB family protein n=1 Tax=unclassified Caulobacter TaxID=2648921 RepID=UPI0009EB0EC5|nr:MULTISPECIES: oxygenase MpaB family protein [unclassified Caulobacter]
MKARFADAAKALFEIPGGPRVDFGQPPGEAALAAPDSVSWRIFKNPVALFVGGVTAVILELAEPRVRTGVWEHSSFRDDPLTRLKRTGLAAMVTVYGARSVSEAMIAGVGRQHARIEGVTPGGTAYRADDVELLDWVQATASFGFLTAYHALVRPLSREDRDRLYAEAAPAARLYGAVGAPTSEAEWEAQLAAMLPRLERSAIVLEFLTLMRGVRIAGPLSRLQHPLIRAAVGLVPAEVRAVLGLGREWLPRPLELPMIRAAARLADRTPIPGAPPYEASVRMGLPGEWLYRAR